MLWRGQDPGVITVRDVLYHALMCGVTLTVLWQTILSFLHAADDV